MTGDIAEDLSHMLSLSVTENATLRADIAAAREEIGRLKRLLSSVAALDLSHLEEASPQGWEHWNEVFEDRVQVTAWAAWQRDARTALAGGESDVSV